MNPIIPMSVLSGFPSRDDISRYLDDIHSVGIEQIMLYPRKGCEVSYMTEDWEKEIGILLVELEIRNMRVFLNDDYYFPSGNANGIVTAVDDYCLKSITYCGENKGRINTVQNQPERKRYADVMNGDAMDLFIKESHQKYFEMFPSYFGNVIAGFYTDEPSISYFTRENEIPYYVGIEKDYTTTYQKDFNLDLQNESSDFVKNVYALCSEQFKKCYSFKISNWCREHHVIMAGHLYEDDQPTLSIPHNGKITTVLPEFMLPGIDEISTAMDKNCFLSLLGMANFARSDLGALAEIFALGPIDMSYAKQRAMMYMCACFGINHYFFAISHMNVKGNRLVNNFFNHFGQPRPDFDGMKHMTKEALKAQQVANSDFVTDVYVRYPFGYLADALNDELHRDKKDELFLQVINTLSRHQIGWRFIAEDDITTKDHPIIEVGKNELLFDGKVMMLESIIEKIPTSAILKNTDGSFPEGLFVRRLQNGKFVIVNFNGDEGDYLVQDTLVHIEKYGVVTSDSIVRASSPMKIMNDIFFALKQDNKNVARMMYINDETKAVLVLEKDLELTFSVREECDFLLDGKHYPLHDCHELGKEFDLLYRSTNGIMLSKGTHEIVSGHDYKYLPSVLITGDFACEYQSDEICTTILKDRKQVAHCGETFVDHGVVAFSTKVCIPESASKLKIIGNTMYTSAELDGVALGSQAFAPFLFALPEKHNKECVLTIRQYSSLGSYFGDTNYFNYHQNEIRWRSTKPSHPSEFGIEQILFF